MRKGVTVKTHAVEPQQSTPNPSSSQAGWRRRASSGILAFGVLWTLFGLATSFSGFGLIFLLFAPLWFVAAAILHRSRWRIAVAVFVLGCWLTGAGFALA